MMRMLEDSDMRTSMGSLAMKYAAMHFDIDKMVKRYENAYHLAVGAR